MGRPAETGGGGDDVSPPSSRLCPSPRLGVGELFGVASLMALMSRVSSNASNFASHSQISEKKHTMALVHFSRENKIGEK